MVDMTMMVHQSKTWLMINIISYTNRKNRQYSSVKHQLHVYVRAANTRKHIDAAILRTGMARFGCDLSLTLLSYRIVIAVVTFIWISRISWHAKNNRRPDRVAITEARFPKLGQSDATTSCGIQRGNICFFLSIVFTDKSPSAVLEHIEQFAKSLQVGSLKFQWLGR